MRSFLRGIAAYLAATVAFVWEAGRWVARTLTNSHPIQPEISAAEAEADALMEHAAVTAGASSAADARRLARYPLATPAKEWLWHSSDPVGPAPSISHLPETVQAWLHSLTPDEARYVREDAHPSDLEAHLAGTRQARGLPRVPTQADLDALVDAAEHNRRETLAILQELLEPEPARIAA